MLIVAPHATASRNVRLQVGETGASGPYSWVVYTPFADSNVEKEPHGFPAFWFCIHDWYMTIVYPGGLKVSPLRRL
jgi:hypothetical protein